MIRCYNLPNIRKLLGYGFSDEELRRLCFDMLDFRPVYEKLTQQINKVEIVDLLLEYAERKVLLENLLAWAQEHNPAQYKIYQPYYSSNQLSPPTPLYQSPQNQSLSLTASQKQRLKQRWDELQAPLTTYNRRLKALQNDIAHELDSERRTVLEERLEEVREQQEKIQTELEGIERQLGKNR